jgi:ribonuclease R
MRFMEDRVGEDFSGIILSCTKYGFFVELDDLFIEGLVPLTSLSTWGSDERFIFRETDKQIVSTRGGRAYRMGQRIHVLLDRIDRQQRRLQFAIVPSPETQSARPPRNSKVAKATENLPSEVRHSSPDRSGKKVRGTSAKKKTRLRDKKNKGKRK